MYQKKEGKSRKGRNEIVCQRKKEDKYRCTRTGYTKRWKARIEKRGII